MDITNKDVIKELNKKYDYSEHEHVKNAYLRFSESLLKCETESEYFKNFNETQLINAISSIAIKQAKLTNNNLIITMTKRILIDYFQEQKILTNEDDIKNIVDNYYNFADELYKKEKAQRDLQILFNEIPEIKNIDSLISEMEKIKHDLTKYDPLTDNINIADVIYSIKNKENNYTSDLGLKLRYNGINVISAITGHGKTIVTHNLIIELLEKEKNIILFSLESPKKEVLLNLLEIKTRMQEDELKQKLHSSDKIINDAKDFFYTKQDKELFIFDNIYLIEDIIKKTIGIKRLNDDKELFVFLDFMQLIEAEKDFSPRTYLIEYALKQLINLANKEDNITFIITCQVNREGIKNINQKKIKELFNPLKSYHLKDSASIEHAANRLYTIFNKYYFLIDNEIDCKNYEIENCRGLLNIKSNKVRNEEFISEHIQLRFDDSKKLKLSFENRGPVNDQEKNETKKQGIGI